MYIPLRIMTHSSIGQSTLTAATLAAWAVNMEIPALGIAENNTLAGSLKTSKTLRTKGVQPLLGAQMRLRHGDAQGDVIVYARTDAGHKALLNTLNKANVTKITTDLEGFQAGFEGVENDIVVLTGDNEGALAVIGAPLLGALENFGHVYVEINRVAGPKSNEAALRQMALTFNRPLVATSPMVCEGAHMRTAHESYLCIASKTYLDNADRPALEEGAWLVDADTFQNRFADLPDAVRATIDVARLCQTTLDVQAPKTPSFPVKNVDAYLIDQAQSGLAKRLEALGEVCVKTYQDRLTHEVSLISKMGFSGYFLIVADFINWAREQGIPVGPGRGSGAGSLVAYALGITDIDPIRFGLLFERFLNPDRVSMPDFDIDFSQARREEVIAYVRETYGADKVALIGTYSVLQARAAVRAVGRVMGLPYILVDKYAQMIPQNPTDPISLQDAMDSTSLAQELADAEESVQTMFDVALKLEGLYAHMSTHAAGVVISDTPVADIVPVHLDDHDNVTTSFDMKDVENSGLVKFDFLGLKNLDIIDETVRFATGLGQSVDLDTVKFEDQDAYTMLAQGDGFGVFQVESGGMKRSMKMLNVDGIEDLIALISLYRPGPMDQIPTYAAVKAGLEDTAYPHPSMSAALDETYGVMVYQEQVMKIAQDLAGYTLGEADLLRRAMGKKIREEMDAQRDTFVSGAMAGWVDVESEDGSVKRLHANTQVVLNDGSGRRVSLSEALDKELDVLL